MESETIIEIIDKLIGSIHAIGSTPIDNDRYKNLLVMEDVVYWLIDQLTDETDKANRGEYSMSRSGKRALDILSNIKENIDYYLESEE